MDKSPAGLNFSQACKFLERSPDYVTELRRQGLIACINQGGQQVYPRPALELTQRLIALAQEKGWMHETIAWYADLVFITEVGRAILLPMDSETSTSSVLFTSWLETPYVSYVLQDIETLLHESEGPLITLLRSLVAAAVGEGQFWPTIESLSTSPIYPIIAHFETVGIPIMGQKEAVARDIGAFFTGMYALTVIGQPISQELGQLVSLTYTKLKGYQAHTQPSVSTEEQQVITNEKLVAVDKMYASRATEIHSQPEVWDAKLGMLIAQRRTIALQLKVPLDTNRFYIDNIIDLIRPYLGAYGARAVHLMYEIANDAPYWRNPQITIDSNEFLDRMGLKRDSRGVHYSRNRERLRDTLNAAHNLEIVGEYTAWENGRQVRKALRKTVLSLIGATFDADESRDLSTTDLFQRGLPKTMQIRLNFYDGVRRPDGKLGNYHVLMPRLAEPKLLPSAKHAATHELLRAYLLSRYRQAQTEDRVLTVTRQIALEKANIKNKNVTRATQTLVKALEKLVADNIVEQFGEIPIKPSQSFIIVLSSQAALDYAAQPKSVDDDDPLP